MRTTPVRDCRAPESRELRYVFNGHPVRTGPELVEAMRRDWQAAGDLLAGRVDPGLEEWLRTRPGGDDVVRELRLETSGGARLIRLQAALDPGGPLMFQGREVTDASLDRAIRAANSWTPDAAGETDQCHRWLTGIRREQILKAMAAVVEGGTAERLGVADQRLRTWSRQTRDVLDRIPEKEERTVAEGAESACLGLLFSVALGATGPEDSHRRVMAAVSNRDTAGAPLGRGPRGARPALGSGRPRPRDPGRGRHQRGDRGQPGPQGPPGGGGGQPQTARGGGAPTPGGRRSGLRRAGPQELPSSGPHRAAVLAHSDEPGLQRIRRDVIDSGGLPPP